MALLFNKTSLYPIALTQTAVSGLRDFEIGEDRKPLKRLKRAWRVAPR
jgi:hypothetical protein